MGPRVIGVHPADDGGLPMAVRRAAAAGARALQVFTAPPTYYNEKVSFKPDRAAQVHDALAAAGIDRRHLLVHAAYVLNTASPEEVKAQRAKGGLAKELERSTVLGAGACCFHPGSAGDGDPADAAVRVSAGSTARSSCAGPRIGRSPRRRSASPPRRPRRTTPG